MKLRHMEMTSSTGASARPSRMEAAIIATVTTAGRTIIFSAATVTLEMTGLLVFPTYFLRSVGITASAVVILSAISAIVLLPALLDKLCELEPGFR